MNLERHHEEKGGREGREKLGTTSEKENGSYHRAARLITFPFKTWKPVLGQGMGTIYYGEREDCGGMSWGDQAAKASAGLKQLGIKLHGEKLKKIKSGAKAACRLKLIWIFPRVKRKGGKNLGKQLLLQRGGGVQGGEVSETAG